jgi:hypothetical protein
MADPVVLSGSSLNTFLRCPTQWELLYVRRIRRPPNLKMALGISGHAAAEADLKHKVQTWEDLPREEVVQTFVDSFHETAHDSPEKPEKKETRATMLDSGVLAVGTWYDEVAPTTAPVLVEQNGQFTINDIHYDWTADLVDQDTIVRDFKFVGRKPDSGSEYALNMIGYALGFREMTGEIEAGVQLDYVVRTKKPYYLPLAAPTIPPKDISAFADIVTMTHQQISAGSFPPHGLKSGACSWCGVSDLCPYYRRAS